MVIKEVKRNIVLRVSIIFIVLILVLTFFSKTMATVMLTSVKVVHPVKGKLVKEVALEGQVEFRQKCKVYAPVLGDVVEENIKVGEHIKQGQKLYLIDISKQKKENVYNLESLKLQISESDINISGLNTKLSDLKSQMADLKEEIKNEAPEIIQDDKVDAVNLEMLKAQVATNEELYKEGLISEEELKLSKKAVLELETQMAKKATDLEKDKKEKVKNANKEQEQLMTEYKATEESLALAKVNREKLILEQKKLLSEEEKSGQILTKESGVILEQKVSVGEKVSEGQELVVIGLDSKGYCVKTEVSKEIDFINEGDQVVLKINNVDIEGRIQQITSSGEKRTVEIVFFNNEIKGNEVAKLKFKKESEVYNMLIPYESLYKDGNKYYVYIAKQMSDTLGESYVVKKNYVYVEDYDENYAAINEGISSGDCIIQISENEISEGQKIRVENENEILE